MKESQWDDYSDLMNVSHFSSKPFHITCVTEKTISQYDDVAIVADSLALLQTWKNIPDMVLSVNTSIKQQILLTAAKRNTK